MIGNWRGDDSNSDDGAARRHRIAVSEKVYNRAAQVLRPAEGRGDGSDGAYANDTSSRTNLWRVWQPSPKSAYTHIFYANEVARTLNNKGTTPSASNPVRAQGSGD